MQVAAFIIFILSLSAKAEISISSAFLEDKKSSMTIQDIVATDPSVWQPVLGEQAVFGPTKSRYWLRFRIPEDPPHPVDPIMLEIASGFLDKIEFYAVLDGKVIQSSQTGLQVPFHDRNWGVVRTGSPTFRVPAPRDPRTEYFLAATSHFPLAVPILALPVKDFYIHQWKQLLFLGAFFGCLLMAAVYNAFLAASLRSRLYTYYSAFVASVGMMFFAQEGLSVQFLWRDWPWLGQRDLPIFGALAVIFYAQFLREFLQSRKIAPRLDRLLLACVLISTTGALCTTIWPRLEFSMPGHSAAVGTNLLALLIAIQALRKGIRTARFFFLSSLVFNVSLVAWLLQENNILWFGPFMARGPHLGTAVEVLFLGFALADHIRKINQELSQQKGAMVQSEKMIALGRLAGEISHEINNPLAIIHGNAALIRKTEASPEQMREFAAAIEQTANRISRIVKGMRSLSRDSRSDPFQQISVNSILQDCLSLCGDRAKSENIRLEIHKPGPDLFVLGRSSEICQVLLNLLNNAFDAVEGQLEPWVQVKVEERRGLVELSVTDSGAGVPKDVRARILEPFFTTKEAGKGLGLGLSISNSIVEAHGGTLRLDEKSSNTRFTFTLPLATKSA